MRRITVDEVKAAYKQTGYQVLSHGFELQHEDGRATCPLMTLTCIRRNDGGVPISPEEIPEELELDDAYFYGFILGFDDGFRKGYRWIRHDLEKRDGREVARNFLLGVRDGIRVRRQVPPELNALDFIPF